MTEAQRALRDQAAEFAEHEIRPRLESMNAKGTHGDTELPGLMGALGWLGVFVSPDYGGLGLGHLAKTLLLADVSYASGAVGSTLQASLIPAFAIHHLGTDEQKRDWLPQISAGMWATIAVTEPDDGCDVLGMQSSAQRNSDGSYTLTGHKTFIGNSHIADVHLVIARTAPGRDTSSLSAFLVEKDRPGLSVSQPPFDSLHGFSLGDVHLERVRVPSHHLLGAEGDGLAAAYGASVVCGRLNIAAVALGLHRHVRDAAQAFLANRIRRGRPLTDMAVLRQRLTHINTKLMTTEALTYRPSQLLDHARPCDAELMNAKLTSYNNATESAEEATRLFGGYGSRADYPLPRLARDIRHLAAPAGPDDLQMLRLAQLGSATPPPQWSARFATPYPTSAHIV
ncbi:acyl-CoA dehydrogenase family protein [Streptomyces aureocirculatus]|uniref:acyl-CoA dehydrogenase family protein n=1 Tax=Streptomyces aureocirculatus TaxID=67275 RepID=UPI00068CEE27|nr:acyl-CoA dehydrogenase [Streptomyces aureocirculatus]